MLKSPNPIILLCLPLLACSGCSQGPVSWWRSVNGKAKQISRSEASYAALKKEHERLLRDYLLLESDYADLKGRTESRARGEQSLRATGTLGGRSLSSIAYQVPKGLRPEEELSLAYEHFNEKRFGYAAVTFEDLAVKPEAAALVDANALYTAGEAWFELGNFNKARARFDEAQKTASGDQREKIQKKVGLWMRVIDRKQASLNGQGG